MSRNALWHTDCFRCAKCQSTLSPSSTLLLLSDGHPVCTSCSYSCSICSQPISDEAIITGTGADVEAYHAKCFRCKSCGQSIEELVFAKTRSKGGIYCMACHGERVARSRRWAERKMREKEKAKAAGGGSSNQHSSSNRNANSTSGRGSSSPQPHR
jgi:Rho-type GTPase-activating protein 1/2